MRDGDAYTRRFFKAHKEHSGASTMTELEDTDGTRHTDQASLQRICVEYYKKLYTRRTPSEADNAAAALALGSLQDRVPPGLKTRLQAQLTAAELESALA